jgi:hypothetical protein
MSSNLFLLERDKQRLGIFLFGLGLFGAGLSVKSERALFAASGAPLTEVAALTAFVPPAQGEAEEENTRVLTVPRAFTGLTRRRLVPRRAAPLAPAQAPQQIATLLTPQSVPDNTGGPATDIPNIGAPEQVGATDIPGILTNDETPQTPGAPQGVLEEEDLVVPAPVPEPATWLMLVAGFFLMGSALRGQKKASQTGLVPSSN